MAEPVYSAEYRHSWALVMGVDEYRHLPSLSAAVKGAADLAGVLRDRYQFDVTLLTNDGVTRNAVFNWLDYTADNATPDDRVLIYFGGHGMTRGTASYELGYLALTDTEPGLWHTALPMGDVAQEAHFIKAKHLLYLLDCCFGGLALEGRAGADLPRELDYYLTRPVRYAISAGGREVVDDRLAPSGEHSLFSYHLLDWLTSEHIQPPGGIWRARELGNYLEQAVARDRRSGHKPNHNYLPGSGDGDFLFRWAVGPRLPRDMEIALRSERGYVRWGAVAALIEVARGDDPDLATLSREWLGRMAQDDPDERVRGAAQSFFDEEEALRLAEEDRIRQAEVEARLEEVRRLQAEAEEERQRLEVAERERREALERARKAREITPPPAEVAPPEPPEPEPAPEAVENASRLPIASRKRRGLPAWVWLGGVVVGAALLVGVLALVGVFDPPATPTPEPTQEPTLTAGQRARQLAEAGVPRNADWTFYIEEQNGVEMALVPAGCFQMGSSEEEIDAALVLCNESLGNCQRSWYENEVPQHRVCFEEPFWIDVYEVTNAEYAAFLNAEGNQREGGATWLDAGKGDVHIRQSDGSWAPDSGYGDHPVVEVTWYGTRAYCEWRGGRLPTEAEWAYAARGPDGLVYPWGNSFDGSLANYCDTNCQTDWRYTGGDDGYVKTSPVGNYPSGLSWVGALDMSGNVWERVNDWYYAGHYSTLPEVAFNPQGPSSGEVRVMRGGSWLYALNYLRAAERGVGDLDFAYGDLGIRCARSY